MVGLDTVHNINRQLLQSQRLVAVFVGGTGGIGAASIRALVRAAATHDGKGLRIYIIGRKASAAEELIAECKEIFPKGRYHYLKVNDLSLIKEADEVCMELKNLEERHAGGTEQARIDYLMVSHGGPIFLPREDTKEGIDGTMSRFYYSRVAFIDALMPLLLRSTLPATVVSIYAAGMEGKLYRDDLSLRDPSHYSYSQARSHTVYMHTAYFEELAKRHPGKLRLTHIFPGLVVHQGMYDPSNPWWLRLVFIWIMPLLRLDVKEDEAGQRMISLASPEYYPPRPDQGHETPKEAIKGTNGRHGSGAYALTWSGEDTFPAKTYRSLDKEVLAKELWDHTNQVLDDIRKKGSFTE